MNRTIISIEVQHLINNASLFFIYHIKRIGVIFEAETIFLFISLLSATQAAHLLTKMFL